MTFDLRFACAVLLLAGFTGAARADKISVRGKDVPLVGDIKSEDAKSVVVAVAKKKNDEIVPGADIVDIEYENIKPIDLTLPSGAYRAARAAEKDADTAADPGARKTALGKAIAGYNETLKKMVRDTQSQKYAARHLEYKVALLTLHQDASSPVAKLQEFKAKFPNSWQINHVMPLIAHYFLDAREFADAEKTYQEIADMEVFSPEVRRDAELMVVQVNVRNNKIELAQKQLDALAKKAGGNPAFASRVKMARAEVFVGMKQFDKAIPLLNEVVKENNDKQTKALAHNTLGECLFKAGKFADARWEFLWVDTVFNQDRGQHAKALYYLWKTFEQLNDAEQECREALLSDRQFAGTEYQVKGMKEAK